MDPLKLLLALIEAPAKCDSCLMCWPCLPMIAPTASVGMKRWTVSDSGLPCCTHISMLARGQLTRRVTEVHSILSSQLQTVDLAKSFSQLASSNPKHQRLNQGRDEYLEVSFDAETPPSQLEKLLYEIQFRFSWDFSHHSSQRQFRLPCQDGTLETYGHRRKEWPVLGHVTDASTRDSKPRGRSKQSLPAMWTRRLFVTLLLQLVG